MLLKPNTARDISYLKQCKLNNSRSTSQALFAVAGIQNVSKTTRQIIGIFAKQKKKVEAGLR